MSDVTQQLRAYLDHVVEPVELDDIAARIGDRRNVIDPPSTDAEANEGEPIVVDIQVNEIKEKEDEQTEPPRRTPLVFAAAVAVLIVALGVAVVANRSNSTVDSTDLPEGSALTAETAMAVVERYFAAHNDGDIDATFALFTDTARFGDAYTDERGARSDAADIPDDELDSRADWERRFAWDIAQGEQLLDPDCVIETELPGVEVVVICGHGTLDAVVLAIGSDRIPTISVFTVQPGGIADLRETYGFPDFGATGVPFIEWLEENHPDDTDVADCCSGATVEDSITRGRLRAELAAEYADALEAAG